jgi:hypothetical protein
LTDPTADGYLLARNARGHLMNPEHHQARLLLALACERWDELRRLESAGPPIDPRTFAALARASDVHPWIHHLVASADHRRGFDPGLVEELATARAKVRRDNLLLLGRAEQALEALGAAGVVPVVLKGTDFLHRIYDGFDQRTIDDVDLLVRESDLGTALDALEAAGWSTPAEPERTHYVRSSHHLPLKSPGPVPVEFELHWNLAQSGRYTIDVEGLFARAEPLGIAGRQVLRLDDVDAIAHLLIHHFSHYFDRRLKWLVDLRRLAGAGKPDWEAVAARVRSWNGSAAAAVSMRHLAKLDADLFPSRALDALPLAAWRRLLTAPLASAHPLELFRGTAGRLVQLYLAAVMLEHPAELPGWLLHRVLRDRQRGSNPLDPGEAPRATAHSNANNANSNADASADR